MSCRCAAAAAKQAVPWYVSSSSRGHEKTELSCCAAAAAKQTDMVLMISRYRAADAAQQMVEVMQQRWYGVELGAALFGSVFVVLPLQPSSLWWPQHTCLNEIERLQMQSSRF